MRKTLLALIALASSTLTQAQTAYPPEPPPATLGFYAGGLFGWSQAKSGCIGVLSGGGRACDRSDLAFGFFGGLQMHRHYGIEAGYTYLGKVRANSQGPGTATSDETQASVLDAAAVGFLPLSSVLPVGEGISAFARLGGYRATLTTTERGVGEHGNFGWAYGGGLQLDFARKVGLRALWQRYKNVGGAEYLKQNYDVLGFSAFYRFQ